MSRQEKRIRIGTGFDFHPFKEGRKLVLGGVEIPADFGLAGHSDADALIHAVCDALLGAIGQGDIGILFPDDDSAFRNISSLVLLREVFLRVRESGYCVGNIDTVVIAQKPRIKLYAELMKRKIAEALEVDEDQVGIKATTMEKCGTIGREEGLAAQAVAMVYPMV